jgi:hypothetical protein
MRGKKLLALGLAASVGVVLALPAEAQMRTSTRVVQRSVGIGMVGNGPTSLFTVPRARTLGIGNNIVSTGVLLGGGSGFLGVPGIGAGTSANSVSLSTQLGITDAFQLDMGIGGLNMGPTWSGRLNMAGKWAFVQEEAGAFASLSGLAGGILTVDPNGNPNLGVQLGLPISKVFPFGMDSYFGLSLYPNYNLGVFQPAALLPGGAVPSTSNFFAIGGGADLALGPALHLMADTNIGLTGVTGAITQTNLGVRYAFTPNFLGDLFVGFNTGAGLNLAQTTPSLGIGAHWGF